MARPIVLSNGSLHVGINTYGQVHDLYFPYVGLENHTIGESTRHKIGVWIDGKLSWLEDESWRCSFRAASDSLIGHVKAYNDELDIMLEFDDFVDSDQNIFFRNIHVVNRSDTKRSIRLFMHQAFVIGDSRSNTDTAQYIPDNHAILHYRGDRAFVVGGKDHTGKPFDQWSIGLFGIQGREGTYRDAEDGELSMGLVEHGRVDSTIRFSLEIDPHSSGRVQYWITVATTQREAISLHKVSLEYGILPRLKDTIEWWHHWLEPARRVSKKLPAKHQHSFMRSLMLVKSHIDDRGAVIASTDSAMRKQWKDVYAYFWPRDGVYSLWPLMRIGYTKELINFFDFCKASLHPAGYLAHKYRADGSIGSSWHPYVHDDLVAPPIQEDETASTLFLFCQYYNMHPSDTLLDEYYSSFVKKMAEFLVEYIDNKTHLPKPSYNLWEESFMTSTYTTSVVQAALFAAADLAEARKDETAAVEWRSSAEDIRVNAMKLLFDHKSKTFRKGILAKENSIEYFDELDMSSFFGPFMFGLVPAKSEEMLSMRKAVVATLGEGQLLSIARYENDNYLRLPGHKSNGWYICLLWIAQHAKEIEDTKTYDDIIQHVLEAQSETGTLSEQHQTDSGEPLSVSPLVWSHAELVSALLDTVPERE